MLLITFVGSRVLASKFDEMRTIGAGIVAANRVGSKAVASTTHVTSERLLEINMQADCDKGSGWHLDVEAYEKFIEKY